MKKKRGRPPKVKIEEEPPKRKRGRPKGKTIPKSEKLLKSDEDIELENPPEKKKNPIPKNFLGHTFKKGESGNPDGGKKHNPAKKLFRAATDAEFRKLMDLLINGDIEALKKISNEANSPTGEFSVLQVMTARVALKIIATGNAEAWEKFLTRTYGKPKENISLDLGVLGELKSRVSVIMPSNGREVKK